MARGTCRPVSGWGRRWFPGLLCQLALLRPLGAKELKYPEGVQPGDQISGSDGEFFRYKHVLIRPPDDEDRVESLKMSEDIKCTACEILVRNLLKKTESNSEDHIMDQFDGELQGPVELVENEQENRVNANRKGCNKHFKDDLLLKGWIVKRCPEREGARVTVSEEASKAPGAERRADWCLEQLDRLPTERDVDTYSTRNEAAFYACENTVGRYGQEMASAIAERLEDGGQLDAAIRSACYEAAKCEGVPRRSKKAAKAGGRRKRRRSETTDL